MYTGIKAFVVGSGKHIGRAVLTGIGVTIGAGLVGVTADALSKGSDKMKSKLKARKSETTPAETVASSAA
jgi:hypothetical protein